MNRTARRARALSAVFFDDGPGPDPPSWIQRRASTCMADALEVLEHRIDDLGVELATATYHLLRAMRDGTLGRVRGRLTAEILLRYVAEEFVDDPAMLPLIELLGALVELPDGPDRENRFLDPTPDPDLPVEVALAVAVSDPDAVAAIVSTVARGRLHAPVLDLGADGTRLEIQFLPLLVAGDPAIATFTSRARFEDHARATGVGDVPVVEIDGAELAELCPPGHGVFVNPGSVLGHRLSEAEVRRLAG